MASTNVFSPLCPEWLIDPENVGYDDEFWEIINFYMLHSLCDGQSWKKNSLENTYSWKKYPWSPASYLKTKLIKAIWDEEEPQIYMAKTRALFEGKIYGKNLDEDFYKRLSTQRVGFVKVSNGTNNDNIIMSMFYHIRNALAHGRYGLITCDENDYFILMEDGSKSGDFFEVTARMILKKSSLVKMIRAIKDGPEEEPDYGFEILEAIKRGNNTRTKICEDIEINEQIYSRETQKLRCSGKIKWNKKIWELTDT